MSNIKDKTLFDIIVKDINPDEDEDGILDMTFKIRYDDNIRIIARKIAVEDQDSYRPDMIRLYVIENGKKIYMDTKQQAKMVLYDLTQTGNFDNNTIYLQNLHSELAPLIEEGKADTDNDKSLLDSDSKIVKELFDSFRDNYPLLTITKFHELLMYLNEESEDYEKTTKRKYGDKMIEELKKYQTPIEKLPKNPIKDPVVNTITERRPNGEYDLSLSNLLLEYKKTQLKFFINSKELFNIYELSEKVPFISVSTGEGRGNSYQKVVNSFQKDPVKVQLAKSWMLTGTNKMKNPRGTILKVAIGDNRYVSVNIYNNGRVNIRITFTEQEYAKEKRIKDIVKIVSKVISNINTKYGKYIFDYSKKDDSLNDKDLIINVPKYEDTIFRSINATMKVFIELNKRKIEDKIRKKDSLNTFVTINNNYERNRLKKAAEKGIRIKPTDSVYLRYNKYSKHIESDLDIEKEKEKNPDLDIFESGLGFTMRNDLSFENSVTVKITNAQRMFQLQVMADFMVSLVKVVYSEEGKVVVSDKIKKSKATTKLQLLKETKLYSNGPVDGRNCQKNAQPQVDINNEFKPLTSDEIPKDKKGNKKPDSYALTVKGIRLVCTNPAFPYPGYHVSGIPCCFREPQKDKENFIRWHNPEKSNKTVSNRCSKIYKTSIITTKKILNKGRIGELHGNIKKLMNLVSKNFYRVGIHQQKDSFLNAIFECICEDSPWSSKFKYTQNMKNYIIKSIDQNLFYELQNGKVKRMFNNITTFKNHLLNTHTLDDTLGLDLLSSILNINIFILSEKSENIICNSDYDRLEEQEDHDLNIILLKKDSEQYTYYEPIFKVKSNDNISRTFENNSKIIKILKEIYISSCNKNPVDKSLGIPALSTTEINRLFNKNDKVKDKYKLIAQVFDTFYKVTYLIIREKGVLPIDLIVPIKPSKLIKGLKQISYRSNDFKNYIRKADPRLIEKYENMYINTNIPVRIKSQILKSDKIIALMTESNLPIPTKTSERIMNLPIDDSNFYSDVTDNLSHDNVVNFDERLKTMEQLEYLQQLLHQIRYEISEYFNNHKELADKLRKAIMDNELSRIEKLNIVQVEIYNILEKITVETSEKIPDNLSDIRNSCYSHKDNKNNCVSNPFCKFHNTSNSCKLAISKRYAPRAQITKMISQEIIKDTGNQLILSGKVTAYLGRSHSFITRPTETILFNVDNVMSWLSNQRVIRKR